MKIWAAILVVAFILVCFFQPSPAQQKEPKAQSWEYKRVENPTDASLATIGADGWELVATMGGQPYVKHSAGGPGNTPGVINTAHIVEFAKTVFVFKRSKR